MLHVYTCTDSHSFIHPFPSLPFPDLAEVELGTAANIIFPNPNDLTDFKVEVMPESGFWTGAKFNFSFRFPAEYPHTPPKVTCLTKILHPNIDWDVSSKEEEEGVGR